MAKMHALRVRIALQIQKNLRDLARISRQNGHQPLTESLRRRGVQLLIERGLRHGMPRLLCERRTRLFGKAQPSVAVCKAREIG